MPIIAEIGQNHCGNMKLAKKLITEAYDNGATFVKFQLYDSKQFYGKKQKSELSRQQAFNLFDYAAKEIGIPCFFSVTDEERVKWCEDIGVKFYKLAFSQRNNQKLIDCIKETGKRMIVSTDEPLEGFPERTIFLYCIPKYPATEADTWWIKEKLEDERFWGFSDHFIGTNVSRIAYICGAMYIEKHFAIDHKTGVDAQWSMIPKELRELSEWENLCSQLQL